VAESAPRERFLAREAFPERSITGKGPRFTVAVWVGMLVVVGNPPFRIELAKKPPDPSTMPICTSADVPGWQQGRPPATAPTFGKRSIEASTRLLFWHASELGRE